MNIDRSRLQWPIGFIILSVAAIPAFTGWGFGIIPAQVLPGIAWSWPVYAALIHILIIALLGRRTYANILTVAVVVTLPVVYAGAAVTAVGRVIGMNDSAAVQAGIHYTRLCLTMLAVVPLALALMAVLPFSRFERRLILQPHGITATQKKILMVLRVFNHTAFFVIPSLLEVLREEHSAALPHRPPAGRFGLRRISALLQVFTYLAVESICAAVQFVPLWAHEIARLPEREAGRAGNKKTNAD